MKYNQNSGLFWDLFWKYFVIYIILSSSLFLKTDFCHFEKEVDVSKRNLRPFCFTFWNPEKSFCFTLLRKTSLLGLYLHLNFLEHLIDLVERLKSFLLTNEHPYFSLTYYILIFNIVTKNLHSKLFLSAHKFTVCEFALIWFVR